MIHQKGTPWTLDSIKYYLKKEKSPYSPAFSEYKGQHFKHEWHCKKCKGFFQVSWKVLWQTVRGIRQGGCLKCANRLNYTIDKVHQELKDSNRPIICLSKTYENNKKRMLWKCTNKGCNHKWKTTWKHIKGTKNLTAQGCIVCANNVKYTIEKIHKTLKKNHRPITLISTVYQNNMTPLTWECHQCKNSWKTTWASINCGTRGCPYCASSSKTEELVLKFLNKVYGKKTFMKIRPDFLKNPKSGRNLELDIFSENMNLAIEINGSMHYTYNPFFHKNKNHLKIIQERDRFKKKKLKELNINFICIATQGLSLKRLKEVLHQEMIKFGYEIPNKFHHLKIV